MTFPFIKPGHRHPQEDEITALLRRDFAQGSLTVSRTRPTRSLRRRMWRWLRGESWASTRYEFRTMKEIVDSAVSLDGEPRTYHVKFGPSEEAFRHPPR